jgi:uncharacterized alkaline shock family protein YloU
MAEEASGGDVRIADEVIVKLTLDALKGVEGIGSLHGGSGVLSSIMGDKGSSGISVDLRESVVDIDISMSVTYGANVPSVAAACRAAVKEKVEATTGLEVRAVNVLVADIEFPEESPGS